MKILVFGTKSYDRESFEKELADYPDLKVDFTETNLTPLTATLAQGYEAVCAFVNADVSAMTLEVLRGLGVGLVLMRCAGFDAVNVDFAKQVGMRVTRVPAYSPEAIAEHAMALALAANRRICKGYNRVRENNFSLTGLVGETLHGKTAGIVGTGRIGAALCRICKGFGMTVLGSDLYPNQELVATGVVDRYVDYDELYANADFISLHAFLNDESHHMINDESIAKMKDGVIFVNTGRGGLVDTEALIRGILSGKIGAAGLDVYEEENPNVYEDRAGEVFDSVTARLCSFPNVVMTSHQAFFTREALGQIARVTLDNAEAYANGKDFVNRSVVC
ncbi:D-isomer specific 2-hydroxyacid dehydrogenase NAD-binding protein [Olsenella uli DSM 7084]|uniref:D-isomer specific 2-hydroxyacid dehydrogenase NAD-binding protein n=1 Tax=Olsenella uli (strain ATCC 49627 / DSM 7084 / CCUG 31166 / CIP 109912 / JCM 12494 / LMG 11480 / NCIMB 702895 / VPI D76D-27C) TaxID=633147 RepID=E1QZ51_OLSUV|nr:2-hydroxyacid dehydrogenase [Olsenella uli]ADK67665.1 D-isomer specific 2-hydroxyacid dehydrogenase NAD-binding protein [Olsenella uli DSM 7084]EUB30562.1 4-phosphoerythronate dehydrogenase [Olsenella uli MSTE5]KRO13544.1 D-isomer specific 2-hydroxyacid dehydrogenase NAD-binding protein [Olsenella uli DSM 7084]MBS6417268.1 2-hydroxyacid dehydrogenase [Olsenella uli]